jgi:molybdate transport system substrate-binding protein
VRVGIGIAARENAKLDVSTPEALRNTLLAARSITYSDSSTGGLSGINAQKVLDNLGIADAVKAKSILKSGGQDLIASGEAEIGLFNVSEIPRAKGVVLAGKVPAAVQAYINYEAAVPGAQTAPEQALAFLQYMAGPAARARWEAAGLELVSD